MPIFLLNYTRHHIIYWQSPTYKTYKMYAEVFMQSNHRNGLGNLQYDAPTSTHLWGVGSSWCIMGKKPPSMKTAFVVFALVWKTRHLSVLGFFSAWLITSFICKASNTFGYKWTTISRKIPLDEVDNEGDVSTLRFENGLSGVTPWWRTVPWIARILLESLQQHIQRYFVWTGRGTRGVGLLALASPDVCGRARETIVTSVWQEFFLEIIGPFTIALSKLAFSPYRKCLSPNGLIKRHKEANCVTTAVFLVCIHASPFFLFFLPGKQTLSCCLCAWWRTEVKRLNTTAVNKSM